MAYHILIVDDSMTTRAMIKRTLAMADIPIAQCHEASNGRLGLEVLAANKIDLVLADLHMPEMGGVEMTTRILSQEATKRIPVVIVSAEPSADRLAELKKLGARACISKPFTPEAIRSILAEVMGVANG